MHCLLLQGQNKIGANGFVSACGSVGQASLKGRSEPGCTGPDILCTHLPLLPSSIYLPLSHQLCGRPACCLVTCCSAVDIIMTAMLIRPDPVFHLCLRPAQSEWLFQVRPGCHMEETSQDKTSATEGLHPSRCSRLQMRPPCFHT